MEPPAPAAGPAGAFIWASENLVRHFGFASAGLFILAVNALVAVLKIRTYALKVQDRVIRLEERLRLQSVLPEPLRERIGDLTLDQLIGLRFASDAELPSLVEQALANHWNRDQIKRAIQNWRPDTLRV